MLTYKVRVHQLDMVRLGRLDDQSVRASDIQIFNGSDILDYYSLTGNSKWAFLGYEALTFVVCFLVCYAVS